MESKGFAVVEIGSTNSKAYRYQEGIISNIGFKTIEFKNHYKTDKQIRKTDKEELYKFIKDIDCDKVYVFGTSIFRNLKDEEKIAWLKEFKDNTGFDFRIVTSDEENEYTVYGAVANIEYNGKVAVMIGGGGSTELAIVEKGKIIEKKNYNFGAMDTTDMFPELRSAYAKTPYDEMVDKTKELITEPENKADLMILAGGDYIYYYEELEYPVESNKFYESSLQPYCLDVKTMDILDRNFFYKINLDEVCERTNNDAWWRGARGMRLCVKALADILEVKYIIPTRINMVYGIVERIKNDEL